VFFEAYRFDPGGYLHVGCARSYFETTDVLERIRHFSPELAQADLGELAVGLSKQ
jgi:hypothetical protein